VFECFRMQFREPADVLDTCNLLRCS
jgi:hypothetical protein